LQQAQRTRQSYTQKQTNKRYAGSMATSEAEDKQGDKHARRKMRDEENAGARGTCFRHNLRRESERERAREREREPRARAREQESEKRKRAGKGPVVGTTSFGSLASLPTNPESPPPPPRRRTSDRSFCRNRVRVFGCVAGVAS